jgi:hypothetical protein
MNPWLVLVLVWVALSVPAAVLVGRGLGVHRRAYLDRSADRPAASWWDRSV